MARRRLHLPNPENWTNESMRTHDTKLQNIHIMLLGLALSTTRQGTVLATDTEIEFELEEALVEFALTPVNRR